MCMYVTNPVSEGAPYLVHPTPKVSEFRSSKAGASPPEFFQEAYDLLNGIDYTEAPKDPGSGETLETPILPNTLWGVNVHPSDVAIGEDERPAFPALTTVYLDSIFPVGAGNSSYSKTLMAGAIYNEFVKTKSYGTSGHSFGYGACQWLRHCDPSSDKVGSPCGNTQSTVNYNGYCFASSTGTLECGRLAALDNEYGDRPITFDKAGDFERGFTPQRNGPGPFSLTEFPIKTSDHYVADWTVVESTPTIAKAFRCPVGSPATTLGIFVSKRPLIAGCMILADPSYDLIAEVHVPAYCATPADYKVGCMLPTALNFDPTAKQIGECRFATFGCTDSTKLRYNPMATHDDGVSCIDPVYGCTVHETPYEGGASDTPSYRSGLHGDSAHWIGVKHENLDYIGKTVTNYEPSANVNQGCILAIEGCMDSTAANYDPAATIDSFTWCVPVVVGCMMPEANAASSSWPPAVDGLAYDGLARNYPAGVTVHDKSMCEVARVGCMDETAMNYDPAATVQGTTQYTRCWPLVMGCLNPGALNYQCAERSDVPCPGTEITLHVTSACKFPGEAAEGAPAPPSPPPPRAPADGGFQAVTRYTVELSFEAAGTVEENQARAGAMIAALRSQVAAPSDAIVEAFITDPTTGVKFGPITERRRLQSGGVIWTFVITYADPEDAEAAKEILTVDTSIDGITAIFAAAVPDLVVTSDASVAVVRKVEYVEGGLTNAELAGVIAGVIGGVCGMAIGVSLFLRRRSMQRSRIYADATIVHIQPAQEVPFKEPPGGSPGRVVSRSVSGVVETF